MNITLLSEFKTLVECLNFTAAAEKCFATQSTLSKHICSLEQKLGCKLFVREHHRVAITPISAELYAGATRILYEYEETLAALERVKREYLSTLRVGYLHGAASHFISKAYELFSATNPAVALDLVSMEHGELSRALNDGRVDTAITLMLPGTDALNYSSHKLFNESYCIIIPSRHRLSDCASLRLEDLAGETVLLPNSRKHPELDAFIRNAVDKSHVDIKKLGILEDINDITIRIAHEDGIGLEPMHLQSYMQSPGLRFIPLDEPLLIHEIVVIWKSSSDTKIIESFADALYQACIEVR